MKGCSPLLRLCSLAALFLAAVASGKAALVTVNFGTGGTYTITDFDGTTDLTGGNAVTNGDGAVLQLGYFSSGTSVTPFAGTWVALTGEGGANSAFSTTSIGDDFSLIAPLATPGRFEIGLGFDTTNAGTNNLLPTAGTPLAIRIYNSTTISGSTYYQTISSVDSNWQWQTPTAPPTNPVINISLDDTLSSLRRENGTAGGAAASGTFNTNMPITAVPEASTFAFGILIALTAAGVRRRREPAAQ
jgi:hypothetical protein